MSMSLLIQVAFRQDLIKVSKMVTVSGLTTLNCHLSDLFLYLLRPTHFCLSFILIQHFLHLFGKFYFLNHVIKIIYLRSNWLVVQGNSIQRVHGTNLAAHYLHPVVSVLLILPTQGITLNKILVSFFLNTNNIKYNF